MGSRVWRLVFALFLGMSMMQVSSCATSSKKQNDKRSEYVKKSQKRWKQNRRARAWDRKDFSLFKKSEMNYRLLRQGKRARYSNSLDSY